MRSHTLHALFWAIGTLCLLLLGWTLYTPIPSTGIKILSLFSALTLCILALASIRHGKWLGLAGVGFLLLLALWPLPRTDGTRLRIHYQEALLSYRGTPYVWGGENKRGLDCSGLIRRAMLDALLRTGWEIKNPALWREASLLWWNDCSANEMKRGYRGRIHPLFHAQDLNSLSTGEQQKLQMGDLAVTASGLHVLALVQPGVWIQADPNLTNGGDKVVLTPAPSNNSWFSQRVVICRWKGLE